MGPVRQRAAAPVLALATTPIGVFIALEVQLAAITVVLVILLVLERSLAQRKDGGPATQDSRARRIDGASMSLYSSSNCAIDAAADPAGAANRPRIHGLRRGGPIGHGPAARGAFHWPGYPERCGRMEA